MFFMKRIAFFIFVALLSLNLTAQVDVEIPRSLRGGSNARTSNGKDNRPDFFVGGNINSNFGQMLTLNLEGGLYVTDWLRFGVGPRYELYYDGQVRHAFGASAFSEFILANYIVGHFGYEFLNYPTYETNDAGQYIRDDAGNLIPCRKNVHALALGVGFQSQLSETLGIYAQYLLYPLQSENDHYSTFLPMFARVGVTYTF